MGKESKRAVNRFSNYLNGPLGKQVLDNMDEGEGFVLQVPGHILRITKRSGAAVVELVEINGNT